MPQDETPELKVGDWVSITFTGRVKTVDAGAVSLTSGAGRESAYLRYVSPFVSKVEVHQPLFDPKPGEVYEDHAGDRWFVVTDGRMIAEAGEGSVEAAVVESTFAPLTQVHL